MLETLKGIGEKRIKALNDHGIYTAADLAYNFPYKYYDFSCIDEFESKSPETKLLKVEIIDEPKVTFARRGLNYTKARVKDGKTEFIAVWYNRSYVKSTLKVGEYYLLYGTASKTKSSEFVVGMYKKADKISGGGLFSVYKSISGIPSETLKKITGEALKREDFSSPVDDNDAFGKTMSLKDAVFTVHNPGDFNELENAKNRLNLEDLLHLAVMAQDRKLNTKNKKDYKYNFSKETVKAFKDSLPYMLTRSQKTAIDDIIKDLNSDCTMNRMIQGDVGSGKTVVAIFACYLAAKSGFQGAVMVPTEILSGQHYKTATELLGKENINIKLLNSSTPQDEKKGIIRGLKDGSVHMIIGTQSIISEGISFKNLRLIVTDEQHKFGVNERNLLAKKSKTLDILSMSATPIPRSLSLIFYGGTDISVLDERPKGASKITTNLVDELKISRLWQFISKEAKKAEQRVFVGRPRVYDADDGINSVDYIYKQVIDSGINKNIVKVLHGKQKKDEQTRAIKDFKEGNIKILIATTVVEVGLDIQNAGIMVIFNPERLGLASLHQLRGRIGRDGKSGYCFCVCERVKGNALDRLKFFKETSDGFKIAEYDYKNRGSGVIFGCKQHGKEERLFKNTSFSITKFNQIQGYLEKSVNTEMYAKLLYAAQKKYSSIFEKIILN